MTEAEYAVSGIRSSYEALKQALEDAGGKVRGTQVWCPFHTDKHASGSIHEKDGVWRYRCHGGDCDVHGDVFDIRALINNRPVEHELFDASQSFTGAPKKSETFTRDYLKKRFDSFWVYRDPETQVPVCFVGRVDKPSGKKIVQARPVDSNANEWEWGGIEKPPLLYAPFSSPRVVVAEGEKAADALRKAGYEATTSMQGAKNARKSDWTSLSGKDVVIWPDNDVDGQRYAEDVSSILRHLPIPATVSVIDVSALLEKADAADLSVDRIHTIMQNRTSVTPSSILVNRVKGMANGEWSCVPWPWRITTSLTKAFYPGSVNVLCGSPGSGKSLFVLQAAAHWHKHETPISLYELEEDSTFHLMRALAQRMEDSGLIDDQHLVDTPNEYVTRVQWNSDWLDSFSRYIHDAPDAPPTLSFLLNWIYEQAQSGSRLIIVDPVTAALPETDKVWQADSKFLVKLKTMLRGYNTSVLLVTHPKTGANLERGSLDDVAGGAIYSRAPQVVIQLRRVDPARNGTFLTGYDSTGKPINTECMYNRELVLSKTRNGVGTGLRVGFNFNPKTLQFEEIGVRLSKA